MHFPASCFVSLYLGVNINTAKVFTGSHFLRFSICNSVIYIPVIGHRMTDLLLLHYGNFLLGDILKANDEVVHAMALYNQVLASNTVSSHVEPGQKKEG